MDFVLYLTAFLLMTAKGDPEPEAKAVPSAKAIPKSSAEPAKIFHKGTPYTATPLPPYAHSPSYNPIYPSTPLPHYGITPTYRPSVLAYKHPNSHYPQHPSPYVPSPKHHYPKCGYEKPPLCSYNSTKAWCVTDDEYPGYEIKAAIDYHREDVLALFADVADLSTSNSVIRANTLYDETYLCPSETSYVKPLRALNTDHKWRIIVNDIKVDYDLLTQTVRVEECAEGGKQCPGVPQCQESKCLQKNIYHRFLVFDPCDEYFPFAIESFKMPASCACLLGESFINY